MFLKNIVNLNRNPVISVHIQHLIQLFLGQLICKKVTRLSLRFLKKYGIAIFRDISSLPETYSIFPYI